MTGYIIDCGTARVADEANYCESGGVAWDVLDYIIENYMMSERLAVDVLDCNIEREA